MPSTRWVLALDAQSQVWDWDVQGRSCLPACPPVWAGWDTPQVTSRCPPVVVPSWEWAELGLSSVEGLLVPAQMFISTSVVTAMLRGNHHRDGMCSWGRYRQSGFSYPCTGKEEQE